MKGYFHEVGEKIGMEFIYLIVNFYWILKVGVTQGIFFFKSLYEGLNKTTLRFQMKSALYFLLFTYFLIFANPSLIKAQGKYYITSTNQPWNSQSNINAMNATFGVNNWSQGSFTGVNVAAVFHPTTCLVFLDGGDNTANALNTFLIANIATIQNWVSNGGRLLLNAAPNQGGNMNFGFGGVTLNYATGPYSTPGMAAPGQSNHPVFTGSNTPCGILFTGNWFSHGHITGGGTSAIIQGTTNSSPFTLVTLSELSWGSGLAIFGAMTTTNFHQPQPNSNNLLNNILSYLYICCPINAAASPTNICFGSSTNLSGSGAVTYTWFPGNVTATNVVVSPTASAIYTVIGTNSIGCVNATTIAVVVDPPCITVNTTSVSCATLGSGTVISTGGVGPFSYTWMPSAQVGSVATGLVPGTYTLSVHDAGNNLSYTTTTILSSQIPITGNVLFTPSVSCHGATNGTASVVNLSGGSGTHTYFWTNGLVSYTVPNPTNLGAGLWNVTVTDALTGCTYSDLFIITQPFAQNLVVSVSSPTACMGGVLAYTASNSGGTPGPGAGYTYTWTGGSNGTTYSVSEIYPGYYIYFIASSDGNNCVVTQTMAATFVGSPTLVVTNASICPNQTGTVTVTGATSFTWNNSVSGSTYTDAPAANTNYTVLGSVLGCTSIATASILIKPVPVPVFISNSPKCQNQNINFSVSTGTSFVWSGVNSYTAFTQSNTFAASQPSQSGVYHVTVTAPNSCTAATQGTITIHPTPTVIATGGTICITQTLNLTANSLPGSNYVWTGPNNFVSLSQNPSIPNPPIASSGNYTVLATSLQGCTNTASAHVTITPQPVINFYSNSPQCFGNTLFFSAAGSLGASNFNWSGPNGFSSTLINPSIQNVGIAASGIYNLTISNGPCSVNSSLSVTIHPLPVPIAFNSAPVCDGKTFTLGVNNSGVSYTWAGPNGFSNSQQNVVIASAQLNHSGIYTVYVTDANSCQSLDVTTVTVLPNPVVNATGDLVCFGQPAQLGANGAVYYSWFGPGSYTAVGANPIIDPTINTSVWTYTVIGTAANGCTAITTTTVDTRVLPVASLSVTPRVCVNSIVFLNGSGGLSYFWKGPSNFSSNQQNTSFIASNSGMSGTYTLGVEDAFGCRGYATAPVIVDPSPTGNIVGKLSGCLPFCSTYSIEGTNNVPVSITSYTVNDQTFLTSNLSYCFDKPGNYEVKGNFSDEKSCKGTVSQIVKVYPLPIADFNFSPKEPVENQDVIYLNNSSEGENIYQWLWAINDGKNSASTNENTSCFFEDAGKYAVALTVKNTWGCWDTIVKSIEVLVDFNVYIPNAFTPNDDDLNDFFIPVLRGVKKFEINIYDRWGELVFRSNDAQYVWDGKLGGKPCPQGLYNYSLKLLDNTGHDKTYMGGITLYR